MGTYGTQLAEEQAEIGATRTAELLFEEIEVNDDVRYCVFVYLLDGSIRKEVLYPVFMSSVISRQSSVKFSLLYRALGNSESKGKGGWVGLG
jgi:hypothetical protein